MPWPEPLLAPPATHGGVGHRPRRRRGRCCCTPRCLSPQCGDKLPVVNTTRVVRLMQEGQMCKFPARPTLVYLLKRDSSGKLLVGGQEMYFNKGNGRVNSPKIQTLIRRLTSLSDNRVPNACAGQFLFKNFSQCTRLGLHYITCTI